MSEERARLADSEAIWEPGSQRLIRELDIGGGARILEVGGGGGALVEWLADLVGEDGRVVATDVDPRFLLAIERPHAEVHHHDIVSDAVPDGPFDLVHARLVLEHLPERLKVLDKLVAVLAGNGAGSTRRRPLCPLGATRRASQRIFLRRLLRTSCVTRDDAELPQSPTEALMTPLFGTGVARLAVLAEWTRWNSVGPLPRSRPWQRCSAGSPRHDGTRVPVGELRVRPLFGWKRQ